MALFSLAFWAHLLQETLLDVGVELLDGVGAGDGVDALVADGTDDLVAATVVLGAAVLAPQSVVPVVLHPLVRLQQSRRVLRPALFYLLGWHGMGWDGDARHPIYPHGGSARA